MAQDTCPTCGRTYGKRKRCYVCQGAKRKTGETRKCEQCGAEFYMQLNQIKHGEGRCCSYACKHAASTGIERAVGTRYINNQGYIVIKTGVRQWELEHRVIMAQTIGRPLIADEQVHHANGDKQDNRLENLVLMTNSEHQRLHAAMKPAPRERVTLICHECGTEYQQYPYRAQTSHYCSSTCRLKAQHEATRQHWAKKRGEK